MHRSIFSMSLAALVCVAASGDAHAGLIGQAVGYWGFEEGFGTTTADLSTTSPNIPLTLAGTTLPAWQTDGGPWDGAFGNYLSFSGANYLTTSGDQNALNFNPGDPFSVAGWVKLDPGTSNVWLASKMESSGAFRGWGFQARGSAAAIPQNSIELWLRHTNDSANRLVVQTPAGTLPESEWMHVGATYDGTASPAGVALYLNGVPMTTVVHSTGSAIAGKDTSTTVPFNIAGRNNAGNFRGGVDELGVWNRVLTPQEMAGLVTPHPSMEGLVMDDFNYAASGALRDRLGGLGWAGPWGAGTVGGVTGVVLVDTENNLTHAGYPVEQYGTGLVYGTFHEWREINRPVAEPMTGEVWFSFLAQTSDSGNRAGVSLNNDTGGERNSANERFNIGLFGDRLRVAVPTDPSVFWAASGLEYDEAHLIVGRLDVAPGNDSLSLWLNPDFTSVSGPADMPGTTFTYDGQDFIDELSRIGVFAYGGGVPYGQVDALRFATGPMAFLNVTGVPEPGTWLLLLSALTCGLLARRRRRV